MPTYTFAGLRLFSAIPLAELQVDETRAGTGLDISFGLLTRPRHQRSDGRVHEWVDESGGLVLSLSRTAQGFALHFPDLADFWITEDGLRVEAWPAPGIDEGTLRHLLLDQVLPRLLAQRGLLVLHAGAACVDAGAVAFVGQSGRGKSTLVASLHGAGYSALTDDGLVIAPGEGCASVLPTYPSVRLWPAAVSALFPEPPPFASVALYSSKQRLNLESLARTAVGSRPLDAIYVLNPDEKPEARTVAVRRLSPRDSCMAIVGNAFQLDVADRRRAGRLLDVAAELARCVPAFQLSYPRDFSRLPDVHAAIFKQRDQWAGRSAWSRGRGEFDEQANGI